jgi:hypothetical protein
MDDQTYATIAKIFVVAFVTSIYVFLVWFYLHLKKTRKKKMPENLTLGKCILEEPPEADKWDVCTEESVIKELSDEEMVFDHSQKVNLFILMCGILCFISAIFAIFAIEEFVPRYMFGTLFPLMSFCLFYLSIGSIKDKFVFNRLKGTVSYTDLWFKTRTIPFDEAEFVTNKINVGGEYLGILRSDRVTWNNLMFSYYSAAKLWSFIVWFMDKNRPLPPGSAFDPYRQTDYERRKAEGFHAPLYPSFITPPDIDGNTDRYKAGLQVADGDIYLSPEREREIEQEYAPLIAKAREEDRLKHIRQMNSKKKVKRKKNK